MTGPDCAVVCNLINTHIYRVALAGTQQLRSQGLGPEHAHRTERVTRSEDGKERTGSGAGSESGAGTEMGTKSGAGTGTGTEREQEREWRRTKEREMGTRTGTGMGTRVETRGQTQDGNGDGSGDGNENSGGDGNGGEDGNGNENKDRIGGGGREAKKRKKPQKSCRCHMGKGGDLGGKRKKCRKERVGSVAANPDNLENNKDARGEAQGTQGLSKNCISRESVTPLSRLIRGFRNKYH